MAADARSGTEPAPRSGHSWWPDLSGLKGVLMIGGVLIGEHCIVVALGIGADGTKTCKE